MKRKTILAVLSGAALAAALGATAGPADAAATSASFDGTTATLNLDDSDNNVTVSVSGGAARARQTTGGLSDGTDWDSATPGPQTVPANGTVAVAVNGGSGNDAITVLAKNTEVAGASSTAGRATTCSPAPTATTRSTAATATTASSAAKGNDTQNGDAGNDTLVWNNGDATDSKDGGAGNDATEVNGTPPSATRSPSRRTAGRVEFHRTNLVAFTLDSTTERFQVNGLGGNDSLTAIRRRRRAHAALRRRRRGRRHINGSEGRT